MDKANSSNSDFLSSLQQRPYWSKKFNQFTNSAIASKLGINANYLCNLKTGYKQPSKELQLKIDNLYNQIIEAESLLEVNNG